MQIMEVFMDDEINGIFDIVKLIGLWVSGENLLNIENNVSNLF